VNAIEKPPFSSLSFAECFIEMGLLKEILGGHNRMGKARQMTTAFRIGASMNCVVANGITTNT
jgi:hypothetical protein